MKRKLPALVLGLMLLITTISVASTNSDQSISYAPENFGITTRIVHAFIPKIMPQLVVIPDPTSKSTPKPSPKPISIYSKVKYGIASTYGPGYDGLLALPEGCGIKVEVCGPAGCIIRVSNDAGPDLTMQRAGRVIDLNLNDFRLIGGSYKLGLIKDVRIRYYK
jgi:hypothetical protein